MISADEARYEIELNFRNSFNDELEKVEQAIIKAIEEGQYTVTIECVLHPTTVRKIEVLGYKVWQTHNSNYYCISW